MCGPRDFLPQLSNIFLSAISVTFRNSDLIFQNSLLVRIKLMMLRSISQKLFFGPEILSSPRNLLMFAKALKEGCKTVFDIKKGFTTSGQVSNSLSILAAWL